MWSADPALIQKRLIPDGSGHRSNTCLLTADARTPFPRGPLCP